MTQVTIKLFAQLRELAQQDELAVEHVLPCSLAQLREAAIQQYPSLADALNDFSLVAAINQALVNDWQQAVNHDDELAFLPPMTGG